MKFVFTIPEWLHWIVPKRVMADHDKRIDLTGTASTSFLWGQVTLRSELKP